MRMTRAGRGRRAVCTLGLVAALTASGCGNTLPEVSAVEWRLETRPAPTGPDFESLSVFASLRDEDGLDNIGEIWVVSDEATLAWKMTSADWIRVTQGADTWIGASALAPPELGALPRGVYRLVAIDAAGQRAEREFRISGSFPDAKPPTLVFSAGKLSFASSWPETLALAFDGTGALLASPAAPDSPTSPAACFGQDTASRAAEAAAYGYDPSLRMGAFSKRVKIR